MRVFPFPAMRRKVSKGHPPGTEYFLQQNPQFNHPADFNHPQGTRLELMRPNLERLNVFAVQVRYPGESADKAIACEALNLCRVVRDRPKLSLNLQK